VLTRIITVTKGDTKTTTSEDIGLGAERENIYTVDGDPF
jgi:hypothetical protein